MSKEDDLFFSLLNLNLKRSRASFSDESKESTDTSGWVPGMSTRHLFMMNPPPPKRLKKNVKIKNVDIDEKDSRKEEQKRSQQNGNKVGEKRSTREAQHASVHHPQGALLLGVRLRVEALRQQPRKSRAIGWGARLHTDVSWSLGGR